MNSYTGKRLNDIIAIGKAKIIVSTNKSQYPEKGDDPAVEMDRYKKGIEIAKDQLQTLYERTMDSAGEEEAMIFEMHKMMLVDDEYNDLIVNEINNGASAEHAVCVARDNFSAMLSALEDDYLSQRADDVMDISGRLLECIISGNEVFDSGDKEEEPLIVCSEDLLPSQVVSLPENTYGVALAKGSVNNHAAILLNSFAVAGSVGLGMDFLDVVKEGDTIIVDGRNDVIIVDPDEKTLAEAKKKLDLQTETWDRYQQLIGKETKTIDGTKFEVAANIAGPEDVDNVIRGDADSIGLFRSEFIYLDKKDYPTEDEQVEQYKKVLEKMGDKRVVVRTIDIGSDKVADYLKLDKEENPALGLRAIRLCFQREGLLETQLRALYRASVYGNLAIMFPMIANVWEVEKLNEMCDKVKSELKAEGVEFKEDVEIGIMIETPAAALISEQLAPLVDFFSVGTNDLTQYTLAVDRQNASLDQFCDTHHEAILRLIELAAKNAHQNNAWIGICGELAKDTSLTERFLRMGIDELSVSPIHALMLRDKICSIDLSK